MGEEAPFDLSRCTRSIWITHFLRYTCVTFPSLPLYFPRTMRTSSSLRIGRERVWNTLVRYSDNCVNSSLSYVVLCTELLRESRGHDLAAHRRSCAKVQLAALAAGRSEIYRVKRRRQSEVVQVFVVRQHVLFTPSKLHPSHPAHSTTVFPPDFYPVS